MSTTKKATHTPGPWRVGPRTGTGKADSCYQFEGTPYKPLSMIEAFDLPARNNAYVKNVCHVYQGEGEVGSPEALTEQEANARLISAAPEMLAVLKEIAWHIEEGADSMNFGALCGEEDEITVKSAILAAIAKATGKEEGR